MDNKPKIAVLLSSYNGAQFIRAQLDSILRQIGVDISLFIRDDGSTDDTTTILMEYANTYSNIFVELGQNVGVFNSFMSLLKQADGYFDYFSFADQDDIWKEEKLLTAVKHLKNVPNHEPAMYYGRLEYTDEFLNILGFSQIPQNTGFYNALVQNQATGCTIVLNRNAREVICSSIPKWALMHDWWCYLVVSAFGKVIYDEIPMIYYRKHGKNVTPATPIFVLELWSRVKRWLGDGKITKKVTDQAEEFNILFGIKLSDEYSILLNNYLNIRKSGLFKRIRYIYNMPVKRNTAFDNFILKILITLGRF
jgi:glycosyltransferase involved in cell wall biosynthesis